MIRVMLVDDHVVVRAGIRFLLESKGTITIVAEAASGEEALEKALTVTPDVILLDINLPGIDGIETARSLRSRLPAVRLVALSMNEDAEFVQGFLAAGGNGYVPKSAVAHELIDAVYAVKRGERYITQALLYKLVRHWGTDCPLTRPVQLTERERFVICQIARGRSYREIAERLAISEKTVATYRERAADKLGLKTRAELVRYAMNEGMLRDDAPCC
jgi:DNA-binding NarL/FixJ family response regulator